MASGTLFLVDGPSGAGKSHLLRYAERTHGVIVLPKYTTRPPRPDRTHDQWSDLVHVSEAAFREARLRFRYEADGHRYGFGRRELERAIASATACFVVVRDAATIRCVSDELSEIRVVPLFVDACAEVRHRRMATACADAPPADGAREPGPGAHADLYVEVVVNDSSIPEFHDKIDALIRRYASPPGAGS